MKKARSQKLKKFNKVLSVLLAAATRAASSTKCFWNGTTRNTAKDFPSEYATDWTRALKTERIAAVISFTGINS